MSYLLAFLAISILIVLHEFGHFAAAKLVGMRVERFALFFGPLLVKTTVGETEYGVGSIPLGGYAKITGMNPEETLPEMTELSAEQAALADIGRSLEDARTPGSEHRLAQLEPSRRARLERIAELEATIADAKRRSYCNQPVWKRIFVVAAGPFVNLVIAFVLIMGILMTSAEPVVAANGQPVANDTVAAVLKPSAAYGILKPGDRIISVDGVRGSETVLRNVIGTDHCPGAQTNGCKATRPVTIVVQRRSRRLSLHITPTYSAADRRVLVGFDFGFRTSTLTAGPAMSQSVSDIWRVTSSTLSTIARIFEPKERKQLHSVVGIVDYTQQAVNRGASQAFEIIALISLALAIINLFPFLPLDGGHIFWALVEKVRGRRVPVLVMERASMVGIVLIAMLFIVGVSNDVSALFGSGLTLPR